MVLRSCRRDLMTFACRPVTFSSDLAGGPGGLWEWKTTSRSGGPTMAVHSYPVRVDATLDEPRLSRWLWLVKWVLVIPHVLVLAVLWPVFIVLSGVALAAIVLTGRYPRTIFDFNVGVLRWSWRVAYYAAGGFGTDRYPPFALQDREDYPAHFEVDYPEELSRGLALVKWWLLAIPHYLIVGILAGSGVWLVTGDQDLPGWGGGLVTLLAVVAGVVLLVTGTYPRPVFDLILGLDRWVLRVAAYAALMTDEYPPFRLDQGGADPGTLALREAGTPRPVTADQPAHPVRPALDRGTSGVGRVLMIVGTTLVALVALVGLGAVLGGGALTLVDHAYRDADGYVMSDPETVRSPGYAVVTENLAIHGDGFVADLPERFLGTVRVESQDLTGHQTFIGVAKSTDVDTYLAGVSRSTILDSGGGADWPLYDETSGGAPDTAPGAQTFWLASAQGKGTQSLQWKPSAGDWTLVVMTADGASPSVRADVAIGATLPALDDLAIWLLVGGLAVLGLAGIVLAVALTNTRETSPAGRSS